jgi:hypothetical protein
VRSRQVYCETGVHLAAPSGRFRSGQGERRSAPFRHVMRGAHRHSNQSAGGHTSIALSSVHLRPLCSPSGRFRSGWGKRRSAPLRHVMRGGRRQTPANQLAITHQSFYYLLTLDNRHRSESSRSILVLSHILLFTFAHSRRAQLVSSKICHVY